MKILNLATKVGLDLFREFVKERDGLKMEKDGKTPAKDKDGKTSFANNRGNFAVTFDGISFESRDEALEYATAHSISVEDVLAAAINDSKLSAGSAAVRDLTIPPTTAVNADSFAEWSGRATEVFRTAADKVNAPEISSRAQTAAIQAEYDSLKSRYAELSVEEKLRMLDLAVKLD